MSFRSELQLPQHPQNLTLHEAVSKKFDKTPQGAIYAKDLKTIFALTIICLDLTEKPLKSTRINFLSKQFPYSFTVQEAINKMSDLTSTIESSATKTTISYAIKPDLALSLLEKFMTAKLLHTPADRTRSTPKSKVLLQPTPKGVAILQSYTKLLGLKKLSQIPIINSNFNTMDLFVFDRTPITDTVVYSEYFVHILFDKFLGPTQNVWKASNPPDELPSLDHRLDIDDEFDFTNFHSSYDHSSLQVETQHSASKSSVVPSKKKILPSKPAESPFAHTFFTNPESDSHVQYYVSSKGVRLYHNQKFGSITIEYCFNAKAAWQWLMDCTDMIYPHEATMMLNLFYKYGLIEPIIVPPSTSTSKVRFAPLKTSFYTISKKGLEISHWTNNKRRINIAEDESIITDVTALTLSNQAITSPDQLSDEESSQGPTVVKNLDIAKVLSDPGIRYLFRAHLLKEHCAENLDAYIDIKHFSKRMAMLKNILIAYEQQKEIVFNKKTIKPPPKRSVVKLINECLSSLYNIYSSYISVGAPSQINIDHSLREKITDIMLQPTSPLKPHFENSVNSIAFPEPARLTPVSHNGTQPLELSRELPTVDIISPSSTSTNHSRNLNNKNLSIEIVNDKSSPAVSTPTEEEMTRSLELLYKLFPLTDFVGQQILKMLEFDSFTKFISSETFLEANR